MLFCCFEAFFGKFKRTYLFSPKSDSLIKELRNTQKVFFSQHVWKDANPEKNLHLFKQLFLNKPVKGENINQNCITHQSEPHRDKLCFSVVLKHFWGNSQRTSLFSPNMTLYEKSTETLRKFVFLNTFEKGKSWGKFGFV